MIPINKPILGREEIEAVDKLLVSGLLTNPSAEGGPNVRAFEKELAGYHGTKHAVVVNSGTSALIASLIATGIGQGDEVVVPSFTFVATASAVMLVGAKPVFVDIEPRTYNMSPEAFKKVLTSKTKAVIPVDLYGLPADYDEICEIAGEGGLWVIEDSCQAQGASYKGKMAGTLGDMGCFSFYPGKVMTTGEGGAVITDDDELAGKLRKIRTHGQIKGYDSVILGGNFRMPEMEAAIGREQLKKLPGFLREREKNARILSEELEETKVTVPFVPEGSRHNWYLFTIATNSHAEREKLRSALQEAGIGATVYYPIPVHRTPFYEGLGYGGVNLPKTSRASETVLSLPVNPLVTGADIEKMAKIVKLL
jgi:dTDP-4-amino-4,6-dideoxygalactose transaminase